MKRLSKFTLIQKKFKKDSNNLILVVVVVVVVVVVNAVNELKLIKRYIRKYSAMTASGWNGLVLI